MSDQPTRDVKLIQYLNEAYGKERQLETALQAHIAMTTRDTYKKRLKDHLKETKGHARDVQRRIKQLGGTAEEIHVPGPAAVTDVAAAAQTAVRKGAALAQGPLHMVRGTGEQEKLLKNAKTEYANEAEEIATYTAIEALAVAVGDRETAQLAKRIRRDEERMRGFLERLIPTLTRAVATEEIPAAERRTSTSSSRRRSGSAAASNGRTTARASSSRSGGSSRSASASSRSGGSTKRASAGSRSSGSSRSASASSRSSGASKSASAGSRSSGSTKSKSASGSRSTGAAKSASASRRSSGSTKAASAGRRSNGAAKSASASSRSSGSTKTASRSGSKRTTAGAKK